MSGNFKTCYFFRNHDKFTRKAKPIRIIGYPDNQRPDYWSFTVLIFIVIFLESSGQAGESRESASAVVLCRAMGSIAPESIFTLCMLRIVSTASDLLAPYDKTQGDPESYLYLVVNRKMWAEQVQNRLNL